MKQITETKQRSYTEKEAAIYIGLATSTLRQARCHGKRQGRTPVPTHIKIGRSVRYLKDDLDNFLDEMRGITIENTGGA